MKGASCCVTFSPIDSNILSGISGGSGQVGIQTAGKISRDKIREIAETKMPDLNTNDIEAAMKIIEGSARSMGVEVTG